MVYEKPLRRVVEQLCEIATVSNLPTKRRLAQGMLAAAFVAGWDEARYARRRFASRPTALRDVNSTILHTKAVASHAHSKALRRGEGRLDYTRETLRHHSYLRHGGDDARLLCECRGGVAGGCGGDRCR